MYTVNSISEYLKFLEDIKHISGTTYFWSNFSFYRGQANIEWGLTPSLYRQGLFKCESLLLREVKHLCPSEFKNNRFDTLVKMQHFGLPTRLLDATTNPLVALYFACENMQEIDNDAAVYIFPDLPVFWSDDPMIDFFMDYIYGDIPHGISIERMLEISTKKYANVANRPMPNNIFSFITHLTMPIYPVMPAKTNIRVDAQDGTFFICGMKLCEKKSDKSKETTEYYFESRDVFEYHRVCDNAQKLRVPATVKRDILKQLDVLGINERRLFPDLSHQIKYAVDFVKNSYPKGLR